MRDSERAQLLHVIPSERSESRNRDRPDRGLGAPRRRIQAPSHAEAQRNAEAQRTATAFRVEISAMLHGPSPFAAQESRNFGVGIQPVVAPRSLSAVLCASAGRGGNGYLGAPTPRLCVKTRCATEPACTAARDALSTGTIAIPRLASLARNDNWGAVLRSE